MVRGSRRTLMAMNRTIAVAAALAVAVVTIAVILAVRGLPGAGDGPSDPARHRSSPGTEITSGEPMPKGGK